MTTNINFEGRDSGFWRGEKQLNTGMRLVWMKIIILVG